MSKDNDQISRGFFLSSLSMAIMYIYNINIYIHLARAYQSVIHPPTNLRSNLTLYTRELQLLVATSIPAHYLAPSLLVAGIKAGPIMARFLV